jgi:hypothetical protein
MVTAIALVSWLSAQSSIDTRAWTAAEDHRNMMDQRATKALRHSPSDAPNWKYFIPWADKFLHHTRPEAHQ